ncbi:MAG: hypothetical protein RIR62_3078 [Pseudomonadota bacterium]|jgi:hypothetical protein
MRKPFALLLLCLPRAALADGALCDRAAERAAADRGIPLALMQAITRAETGRDGQPWPWTLNINGQGLWFATKGEAALAARTALEAGAAQVDLGCFQLNWQWHGAAFADPAEMLDPDRNAAHAARFLSDLSQEFGDWRSAAAAYHSRTPARGEAYVARLEEAHAAMAGGPDLDRPAPPPPAPPRDDAVPRANGYPLLVGGQAAGGSLVPVPSGRGPIIGGP